MVQPTWNHLPISAFADPDEKPKLLSQTPSQLNQAVTKPGDKPGNKPGDKSAMASPARTWADVSGGPLRADVPEGLWGRCLSCSALLYNKSLNENLHVCPDCDHHHRVDADERIRLMVDDNSFEPRWEGLSPKDLLNFNDLKPYKDRIESEQRKTGHRDALLCGTAYIKGRPVVLAVMDTRFMMASMGTVVGEKITRSIELALDGDRPFIMVSASGGARMQESGLSLMQMAKTSAALARFDDAGGLYISVLTDPTTGGVTASFAMLGDVIFAEPKALIGFAGPRVIANTVREDLPEGFQRSEFLLKRGFVDRVVHRRDMRQEIARVIDYAGK